MEPSVASSLANRLRECGIVRKIPGPGPCAVAAGHPPHELHISDDFGHSTVRKDEDPIRLVVVEVLVRPKTEATSQVFLEDAHYTIGFGQIGDVALLRHFAAGQGGNAKGQRESE